MISKTTRALFLFILVICFGVLIVGGYLINNNKPPIPKSVQLESGKVIFTTSDIIDGQNYYYSRGGQHIGSIWGHGSYLAPDWSADYLHRTGLYIAARYYGLNHEHASSFKQNDFDNLDELTKTSLRAKVKNELKTNRYNPENGILIVTEYQAKAFEVLKEYYTTLFKNGNEHMGLQKGIVRNEGEGYHITCFFAWLSWAAVTNRPGLDYSYTSNWPYDPLVGNEPSPDNLIWSIVSVIILIFFIGIAIFVYNYYIREDSYEVKIITDFKDPQPTRSQVFTVLFFLTAMGLFLLQILAGSITAHYTVEGTSFYGISIGQLLPYALVRTWHLQLSIFWIATCFLAAGLFIGPFVGREPKIQWQLVAILFVAVVCVVFGTLVGTWLSTNGKLNAGAYLLGHQGYEYIELGRLWQILLIAGMLIWLILVIRAIRPALTEEKDKGGLTHMLLYSAVTIPLFYMAGLMYGKGTHLSNAEYWRWWVVHLWVEGFFETFATVVLAFILSHIGAVSRKFALTVVYLTIFLYLGSGVIGTFHHLYWAGSPAPIIALGAVFSALEVVPLALLGFEVARNMRITKTAGAGYAYKWPIYFFIAVAFWNLLGAGVFGFLINPPIVLYFIQATNTTPIHAHAALFGVYGFLAIALMLFSLRHIISVDAWSDRLLKWSFWCLNGGLLSMLVFSLIPSGFYQFYYAAKYGLWYARSPEITSGEVLRTFSWMRILPDLIFTTGALILFVFLLRAIWLSRRKFIKIFSE